MTIETEFEIGEEVYYMFKDKDGIVINKGTVQEILVQKDEKIVYYVSGYYDPLSEKHLLHGYEDDTYIMQEIKRLIENGR